MLLKSKLRYLAIGITVFVLYLVIYKHMSLVFEKSRMDRYAQVISNEIKSDNLASLKPFIHLLCEKDEYSSVEIIGNGNFSSDKIIHHYSSSLNNFLRSLHLLPEIVIESDILLSNSKVATLRGKWNPHWIFSHIFVLFVILFSIIGFTFFRKRFDSDDTIKNLLFYRDNELKYVKCNVNKLVNCISTELLFINSKSEILSANKKFKENPRFSNVKVEGNRIDDLLPELSLKKEIKKSIEYGEIIEILAVITTDNRVVNITISPVHDNSSTAIISFDDVTNFSKLQEKVEQAQKMDSVGNLVGGLAHDFNNLLGGICGSLSVLLIYLQKEDLKNEQKIFSSFNVIKKATNRATEMVDHLLSFSKKHDIISGPVNIQEELDQIVNLCKNSFPKNVEIVMNNVHDFTVLADLTQLNQVLLNLCINAMHSMTIMQNDDKQGGVLTISTEIVDYSENIKLKRDCRYIKITVKDSGVGIDECNKTKIFDPFFSTKKDEGSGLGLAMAYNIIDKCSGIIDFTSEVGVGSDFFIYLPEMSEKSSQNSEEKVSDLKLAGTILVVDDEEIIRKVSASILTEVGLTVITAESGIVAKEILTSGEYHIDYLLVDYSMPGMSGLDLCKDIFKLHYSPKMILSSGFLEESMKSEFSKYGVNSFIKKPFSYDGLIQSVRDVV